MSFGIFLVEGTYPQLLDVFEKVGIELRSEIDAYFAKYNQNEMPPHPSETVITLFPLEEDQ